MSPNTKAKTSVSLLVRVTIPSPTTALMFVARVPRNRDPEDRTEERMSCMGHAGTEPVNSYRDVNDNNQAVESREALEPYNEDTYASWTSMN